MDSEPRPPLPQQTRTAPDPRLVRTMADEQADALSEEFHPFQVWVDFRPMTDGQPHWHARRPHWMPEQNLHAHNVDEMRTTLAAWKPGITFEGHNSI